MRRIQLGTVGDDLRRQLERLLTLVRRVGDRGFSRFAHIPTGRLRGFVRAQTAAVGAHAGRGGLALWIREDVGGVRMTTASARSARPLVASRYAQSAARFHLKQATNEFKNYDFYACSIMKIIHYRIGSGNTRRERIAFLRKKFYYDIFADWGEGRAKSRFWRARTSIL